MSHSTIARSSVRLLTSAPLRNALAPATTLSTLSAVKSAPSVKQPLESSMLASAQKTMSKGGLLPSSFIEQLLRSRLSSCDVDQGYILDGYPRTRAQASKLLCEAPERRPEVVLLLEASDADATQRILDRDDSRSDDTPDVAAARIQTYHKEISGVLHQLQAAGVAVRRVDASHSQAKVFEQVTNAASQYKNIVVAGLPGVGKGTQGTKLAKHLNVPHVSVGDLVRQVLADC